MLSSLSSWCEGPARGWTPPCHRARPQPWCESDDWRRSLGKRGKKALPVGDRQWRNQKWEGQGAERMKGTVFLLPSPLIISSFTALVPALISSAHGLPRVKNGVCVLLLGPPKKSGRTGSVQIDPNRSRLTHGGQSHVGSCPWC